MIAIDPIALVVFLIAVPLVIVGALAFTIAVCRGTRAERRLRES